MDYELLTPWAQMHKDPPSLFVQKWVQMGKGGARGPLLGNSEFFQINKKGAPSCCLVHLCLRPALRTVPKQTAVELLSSG